MAECRVEVDRDQGMVAVRVEGEVALEDLLGAIQQGWQAPAYQARACVLWDLRQTDANRIHTDELRRLAENEPEAD